MTSALTAQSTPMSARTRWTVAGATFALVAAISVPLVAGLAAERWPTTPADPMQCGLFEGPPYGPLGVEDEGFYAAARPDDEDALWMMQKRQGYNYQIPSTHFAQAMSSAPPPPPPRGARRVTGTAVSAAAAARQPPAAAPAADALLWSSGASGCRGAPPLAAGTWAQLDVLGAVDWEWPQGRPAGLAELAAGSFCSLPAAVAYGALWLLGGSGSIQLLATGAFWVLVRPAAAAVESLWLYSAHCPGAPIRLAVAYATAAHFYWAWAALEIAARRRSLRDRLLLLAAVSLILLPIPAAQVLLGDRAPTQAAVGSVVGQVLGVGFFFGLRLTGVWMQLLRDGRKEWPVRSLGLAAHWLTPWDNLTTSWGGSLWPQEPAVLVLKAQPVRGISEQPMLPD